MQVLRDVVAAVAGADHESVLALPLLAVVVLAGMQNLAGEVRKVGISGRLGMPLTPVASTTWRGCIVRLVPSAPRSTTVQRPCVFVVAAALELGAGPEVQLHALDIGLEPVGELVLGDVGRPVRRKRHVGQVIDVHLIVQRQRVVALAPVVADARFAVDDQRVDVQLLQARGDRKPGLSAADDEHGRVAVGILRGGLAQVEPVGAAKIARIGLAVRP